MVWSGYLTEPWFRSHPNSLCVGMKIAGIGLRLCEECFSLNSLEVRKSGYSEVRSQIRVDLKLCNLMIKPNFYYLVADTDSLRSWLKVEIEFHS